MRSSIFKSLLLLAIVCVTISYDVPKGWYKAGSQQDKYDMGTDVGAGRNSNNAATIKSKEGDIKGYGMLMQSFLPDKYIGKRIRYSAFIKTKDVAGWSGLILRIDGKKAGKPLEFDNMFDRPVKGTQEWKKYEVVLDVPKNASKIAYGAILSGTGQIWFDGISFEIVNEEDTSGGSKEPTNLNFEK